MKQLTLIGITCLLVLKTVAGTNDPITPEQRFNLPVAGKSLPPELDPESPFNRKMPEPTNSRAKPTPLETRRSLFEELHKKRMGQTTNAPSTRKPMETTDLILEVTPPFEPGTIDLGLMTGTNHSVLAFRWHDEKLLDVTIETNSFVRWSTVDEEGDTVKQVGTILTNRIAVLVHDGLTNMVPLKVLGKGEWPSLVRTVARPK